MTRHELREQTFKLLFGLGFHDGEDRLKPLQNYLDRTCEYELTEGERGEIVEKVLRIDERIPELDKAINDISEGWRTERMGRPELNILRLALYEMRFDDGVPVGVAINEAVELAKGYCSDEAPGFINGILARLVREETKDGAKQTE